LPASFSSIRGTIILDTAELRGLARLGGAEFVDEVVAMFLDSTAPRIVAAEAARAARDASGVRHVVHAMASSACTIGVRRVERLAKIIEAYAIDENWPHIDVLVPELAPALEDAERAIANARTAGMLEALPPVAVITVDALERTLVHAALSCDVRS
jgi:HPt (histidine-containing phosphotransfer) domain-containing protein